MTVDVFALKNELFCVIVSWEIPNQKLKHLSITIKNGSKVAKQEVRS